MVGGPSRRNVKTVKNPAPGRRILRKSPRSDGVVAITRRRSRMAESGPPTGPADGRLIIRFLASAIQLVKKRPFDRRVTFGHQNA